VRYGRMRPELPSRSGVLSMPQALCRRCQKRPLWRYRNNDIHACKRCYHEVWNDTRRRVREYHAALGMLERGRVPETLSAYGSDVQVVAMALAETLRNTVWQTGAKHEVPLLMTRCERMLSSGHGRESLVEKPAG
jgi:hypothetical protein